MKERKESLKTALITGGSRGLGLACAIELSRRGHRIVLAARGESALASALGRLEGDGHCSVAWDLADCSQHESFVEKVSQSGPIDVTVHALGGSLHCGDARLSHQKWQEVFQLNLFSLVSLNSFLVTSMESKGWGRIIHLSSSAAVHGRASAPYASAKAALNRYVSSLGRDLAKAGVGICAVMPAAVEGEGNYWSRVMESDLSRANRASEAQVIGRFQTPEEIAKLVGLLCSEEGIAFAGSIISADGSI